MVFAPLDEVDARRAGRGGDRARDRVEVDASSVAGARARAWGATTAALAAATRRFSSAATGARARSAGASWARWRTTTPGGDAASAAASTQRGRSRVPAAGWLDGGARTALRTRAKPGAPSVSYAERPPERASASTK